MNGGEPRFQMLLDLSVMKEFTIGGMTVSYCLSKDRRFSYVVAKPTEKLWKRKSSSYSFRSQHFSTFGSLLGIQNLLFAIFLPIANFQPGCQWTRPWTSKNWNCANTSTFNHQYQQDKTLMKACYFVWVHNHSTNLYFSMGEIPFTKIPSLETQSRNKILWSKTDDWQIEFRTLHRLAAARLRNNFLQGNLKFFLTKCSISIHQSLPS